MKGINKLVWMAFAVVVILSSCVSQRKFDDLTAEKNRIAAQNDQLKDDLDENYKLLAELSQVNTENKSLNNELSETKRALEGLNKTHADLKANYERMLAQNQDLIRASSTEKGELSEALANQQKLINAKEKELRELEESLRENQMEMEALKASLAAKEEVMTNLRNKIANSLLGFSDADLSIRQEGGKVYVSLSQNLLFAKGSNVLDNAGKEALKKLADVLNENSDIDINVEGHTDPDGTVDRNWDLSVTRATTIVKILSSYGVDPTRLTASGRALYNPVAPNDSEANKSKNRRTEIILSPKLDELYDLITPKD